MQHRFLAFALVIAAVAFTASAQGPQGPGAGGGNFNNNAAGTCANPLVMASIQTIEGAITSLDLGSGIQYPSIVVNKIQIKLAPVWFLLDQDFEIAIGETVRINAASSSTAGDGYLYAIDIVKTATNESLTLRDSSGQPLWLAANRRGVAGASNPNAPRTGEPCLDPASIRTAAGTVDHVTAGVGIRQPFLVLKSGDTLLTIKLGPERVLLDEDFEIKAGTQLSVKFGLASCTGEFVALELTDAAGRTLVLRDSGGAPAWNR